MALTRLTSRPIPKENPSQHLRGIFIVASGVLVISFDALLIRLAHTDGWNVAFWRGFLMTLSLGLFQLIRKRRALINTIRSGGGAMAVSAILFGLGSLLFVLSVSHTKVANTVVILSASPLFAAFFSRFFLEERMRPRTWAAIGVAIAGVIIVFYGSLGAGNLWGDLLAALAAIAIGSNLTLLRRYPDLSRVTLIAISGSMTALIALPLAEPLSLAPQSYLVLAIMGLIQMPLALVLIASGPRYLPSPEVSLFLLLETVLGPIWVWLITDERPPAPTFAGGGVIIAALVIHSWLGLREMKSKRIP